MAIGSVLGKFARYADKRFGIRAWLKGDPRPPAGGFDLDGEKIIDHGWVCANLPRERKRALEVGCGSSPILPAMLALNYEVVGVDLDATATSQLTGFSFVRGDFNDVDLSPGFDVVVACSAIEHFGLSGRYDSSEDESADLRAMRKIAALLNPGGIVLLTIPVGTDVVWRPWHRVYGKHRLGLLLDGFEVVRSRFLAKEPYGPWAEVAREAALAVPADLRRYALGELILSRK
jgi:SAM-dependent methyltransferase